MPEPSATPKEQRGRRVFTAGAILLVILGLVHSLSLIKAPAPRKLGWWIVGLRVMKLRSVARVTAALEKLVVHMDDALRSALLVQIIQSSLQAGLPQQRLYLGDSDVIYGTRYYDLQFYLR